MSKSSLIAVTIIILAVFGFIFIVGSQSGEDANSLPVENSEIKDGVQYVTITARGGYTPRVSSAQAGIPTKLIMKTTGSFDCSSSLVIRAVGFQEILPRTGETVIDLGTPEKGVPIEGVCGMGMYSFKINFI